MDICENVLAMNTIQMITLKTDDQIDKLGDSLIDKAKELKISVSEITQSAATLYRQGLSDEEVDERLEVISKFSKVSGTKVADATIASKILRAIEFPKAHPITDIKKTDILITFVI